ncbi:MAG: hypothetical protein J6V17_02015 [Bacteroidales bacterium]|nr:hypothetical protein [Bacteroidales bacterium]
MKRHFSFGFKALAACAMSAMLAVSCYDDSKLWEEIEGLEERVAALEEKLNTEVATLNSKIGTLETAYKAADADLVKAVAALTEELDALDGTVDGYITSNDAALKAAIDELKKADAALAAVDTETLAALAKLGVVSVETNANGNVVITFTDKTTLEVPANPESGLVTIVDGHWAVVVDGKTTVLDALVLPDTTLDFRVGDDNTLYVSYDAGKTWESTGIVVDGETLANVVTGVKYNKGDEFVTLVVGQTEYQFPVYKADNASLVLGRTDVYISFGSSKEINFVTEGIAEYFVMSKPDGWKASIDGNTLKVVAPTKEIADLGVAEVEGEILVHANTVDGKCKVVKLNVSTGELFSISVNDATGDLTIFNTLFEAEEWDGEYFYGWGGADIAILSVEQFEAYTMEEILVGISDYDPTYYRGKTALYNIRDRVDAARDYEPGVYEEETLTMNMKDLLNIALDPVNYKPITLEPGEPCVVLAVPYAYGEYYDAVYAYYEPIYVDVKAEATTNDISFSFNLCGADSYYTWYMSEASLKQSGMTIHDYMTSVGRPSGPWTMFTMEGEPNVFGENVEHGEKWSLSEDYYAWDLMPGSKYYVWVFPYKTDKPLTEYVYDTDLKPYIYEFSTTPAVEDKVSVSAPTLSEEKVMFHYINAELTAGTGADLVYYAFYSKDEFEAIAEADYVTKLMSECYNPVEGSSVIDTEIDYDYVKSGDTMVLVMLSFNEDLSKYRVDTKEYKLPVYTEDENINISLKSMSFAEGKYTAVFNVTGADKIVGWAHSNDPTNVPMFDYYKGNLMEQLLSYTGESSTYQWVDVVDGVATVVFAPKATIKYYHVWGYNLDAAGVVSSISAVPCEVTIAEELSAADAFVAQVAFATNNSKITVPADLALTSPVFVTKSVTIDLNGKNIKCDASDVFVVTNGTLTLNGNGVVWGSSDNSSSSCAVWAKENGKVVINGGTYKVGDDTSTGKTGNWRNDCIYARDNAQITVNGGEFMYTGENPDGHTFVLNQKDGSNAKIIVNGGTFHKFNPSASNGENPVANFVAAGYEARETAENVYTVGYPTPVGKQWISADATFATAMLGMSTTTLFDLGVFAPDPSVPFNTFTFSVDYGTMMGNPDPIWLFASYYGTYSVEPKDATSGVLVIDMMMQGSTMNIPYSNLDSDSVTFDFKALGMGEMNFTRPAEQVEVLLTPPTSGDDL